MEKARHIGPKIGLVALVSATYAMVAGGPFGLEEIVQASGYGRGLLVICVITPLLWGLPTTLMVSELASALPETGGFYVWATRALGPFWGFQESWLSFAGSIFDMAIYPILFSTYLAHLLPRLGVGYTPFLVGVLMIVVCAVMNLMGTHFVGEESIFLVLALLAPFAILVWFGFSTSAASAPSTHLTKPDLLAGILIAMWNYMGWDNASTIAGDVKNARRTYSLAMGIALALVVITYLLPILAVATRGHSRFRLGNRSVGYFGGATRRAKARVVRDRGGNARRAQHLQCAGDVAFARALRDGPQRLSAQNVCEGKFTRCAVGFRPRLLPVLGAGDGTRV